MRTLRSSPAWVGAALLSCVASCSHNKTLPPPPDKTAGQAAAWQLAPEDVVAGVVIGDFGQLLERLRALKSVLDSGPATRALVQQGMERVLLEVGFDPLDAEAWKRAGVEPQGPIGLFGGEHDRVQVVFRATDSKKAQDTAQGWLARSGNATATLECRAAGSLFQCGSGTPGSTWAPASDATHSLWTRMQKDLPVDVRGMGLVAYAPLDVGPAQVAFSKPGSLAKGLRATWLGLTLAPERVIMRLGARADSMQSVVPYFEPRRRDALLGLGEGAIGVWRATFSPDQLWALAKKQGGPKIEQGAQLMLAVTGIDLEKELVNNLTGEVVMASYRGAKLGPDGAARPLTDRAGAAVAIGTLDDQKTRHLANRLGELGGGALARFSAEIRQFGFDATYEKEAGDRAVHWFKATLPPERAKVMGLSKIELFVTTIPGALVIGESRAALAELRKRVGKKPAAFLDKLPLSEERAMFEHAPFAMWTSAGDGFAQRFDAAKDSPEFAVLVGAGVATELVQLGQLIYDGSLSFDIKDERAELFYQLTLL